MNSFEDLLAIMEKRMAGKDFWDFSREKKQKVFIQDEMMTLRPVAARDADLYSNIRMQYSMVFPDMIDSNRHSRESLFLTDLCMPETLLLHPGRRLRDCDRLSRSQGYERCGMGDRDRA